MNGQRAKVNDMQLHEVPHIRLNADFEIKCITERGLNNYFRTFKPSEETLQYDCICSPFFESDFVYALSDDYAGRMELLESLKSHISGEYISVRLTYDFSNTPVKLNYSTENEFQYIGSILDELSQRTNLSLILLVSHFRQFGNKSGTVIKPEHFHCLLGADDNSDLLTEANRYADLLSANPLFRIKSIKSCKRRTKNGKNR